jgi:RNA polymerase sigma-70 factor (ECF subfamily)
MADDVAADAFERAFAALSRFDDGRPFAPWLHRIVVNRALDLLRAERRLVGIDAAAELDAPDFDPTAGDRALLDAVGALPLQRRVVVLLRYGVGLSPTEIAGVLDLPVGTVNSRLGRALGELRAVHQVDDGRRARD